VQLERERSVFVGAVRERNKFVIGCSYRERERSVLVGVVRERKKFVSRCS